MNQQGATEDMSGVRVTFLRHAQATHNVDAAYHSPSNRDAQLTAEGVRQAWGVREAGRLGRSGDFDMIYCSPLRRCYQTLLGVLAGVELRPVFLEDRLMEPQGEAICNRRAEWDDLQRSAPSAWCLTGIGLTNPFDVLTEGGSVGDEGHIGFEHRVRAFTEDVLRRIPTGSHVLVVTHHDWIRTWFRLFGQGRGSVSLGNCEWVSVVL